MGAGLTRVASLQLQRRRARRLLKKSEKQIPRGLKPARDDKDKRLNGASNDAPLQSEAVNGIFSSPLCVSLGIAIDEPLFRKPLPPIRA